MLDARFGTLSSSTRAINIALSLAIRVLIDSHVRRSIFPQRIAAPIYPIRSAPRYYSFIRLPDPITAAS